MPKSNGLPRLVFAGTPEFAAVHLKGLCEAGFQVDLVLTQPDGKVGRGRKTKPTPVKAYALEQGIEVLQPEKLRGNTEFLERLQNLQPDFMVVVAYGLIIPRDILEAPTFGCLNVHGSILPRWRGAAPVQRAIESLDPETGVCIMQMDEGLDTGAVRHQIKTPICGETSPELLDKLAVLGVQGIVDVLRDPAQFPPIAQSEQGVNYAHKILKTEKHIDWNLSAEALSAKVRALQPWPNVMVETADHCFKILETNALAQSTSVVKPGVIIHVDQSGILIACGDGRERLLVQKVQLAGGKPIFIRDFLNGKSDYFNEGQSLVSMNTPAQVDA